MASFLPTVCKRRLHCKQVAVRAVRFNADGNYCMTAGGDKTVKLWNPTNGRLLKSYTGHGAEVSDVKASQDNSQLASGGADCCVFLWDVSTGTSIRRWRKHPGRVNAVLFAGPMLESHQPGKSGGSGLLLSCGVDGIIFAWDIRSKSSYAVQKMHEAKDSVTCLAANRYQIISGSIDRKVRIYDLRKGLMIEDFVGHPVTSLAITYDDQCILVGCQDSHVRLFDATNGELLNKFAGHKHEEYHLDAALFNKDSQVISSSEETTTKEIFIWDLLKQENDPPLAKISHSTNSQCWSASLSNDPLPPKAVYSSTTHFINSLSPHPQGSRILTAGGDYVWLWGPPEVPETERPFIGPNFYQ